MGTLRQFTADISGEFFLGVNDGYFPDNTGSWVANVSVSSGNTSQNPTPIRIFFTISYLNILRVQDNAFVRAAETWQRETKDKYSFRKERDVFIERTAKTVAEFIDAWKDIAAWPSVEKLGQDYVVVEGALFTHASFFGIDAGSGLEFAPETIDGGPSTVTQDMIRSLPQLRWDSSSSILHLFGCNTAEFRGLPYVNWSPANEFAKTQTVRTFGETGWSYFSEEVAVYVEGKPTSHKLYLGAYRVGRNIVPGIPRKIKMPAVAFPPW